LKVILPVGWMNILGVDSMGWKGHVQKMMTPLDALDEVAILIRRDATPQELNRWLRKAIQAGHIKEE